MAQDSSQPQRASAVAVALAPYPWRRFTTLMLARRCVAAVDRESLLDLLSDVEGTDVGNCHPLEPADVADDRVVAVIEFLDQVAWRALTLNALSRHLVDALDSWLAQQETFDSELQRLLNDQ